MVAMLQVAMTPEKWRMGRRWTWVAVVASVLVSQGRCASTSEPHPHRGILKPFENGPMSIDLSASDLRCARTLGLTAMRATCSLATACG